MFKSLVRTGAHAMVVGNSTEVVDKVDVVVRTNVVRRRSVPSFLFSSLVVV